MSEQELSQSEALAAAFDKHEEEASAGDESVLEPEGQGDQPAGAEGDTPIEDGVGVEPEVQQPVQPAEGEDESAALDDAGEAAPVAETPPEQQEEASQADAPLAAPASWTPALREKWSEIPKDVQAQIDKREREISTTLTETAEARKHYDEFRNRFDAFVPQFAAEGVSVLDGLTNLTQMAAVMQRGTMQAKAETVAQIIGAYGVDINTLADVIDGRGGGAPQSGADNGVMQMVDQRLAPITNWFDQMQQQQQRQQQEVEAAAAREWQDFQKNHEFAADIQGEMADVLDMAARRGETLSWEDAYKRALQFRPDIVEIIDARKAAANAQQQQQNMEQHRAAASSLAGGGAPQAEKPAPTDMRSQILAAMDADR